MERELVNDDEETDLAESSGEMLGYRIKDVADASTVLLAGYAASRPELPTLLRVGFGIVAITKAPRFLARVKSWLHKD